MYKLGYSEFYITNVCNLNCTNCNRFNNYTFKGHYNYSDYEEEYIKWSKIIDIEIIGILGGEPLLNPDIFNWVKGIANLWPNSKIVIITNGTTLNHWDNLYEELLQYNGRVGLEINHHTPKTWKYIHRTVGNFLKGPLKHEIRTDTINWAPADIFDDANSVKFIDTNNIEISLHPAWTFKDSTIKYNKFNNTVSVHDSNPELAFAICDFKTCHHFIKGKLYKCGPIGILPDFIEQFKVQLTDKQRTLIYDYKPAEHDWTTEQLDSFMDNLINSRSIPQCSLCPQKQVVKPFSASGKKTIRLEEIT
jgi:organic radical activating enzyme